MRGLRVLFFLLPIALFHMSSAFAQADDVMRDSRAAGPPPFATQTMIRIGGDSESCYDSFNGALSASASAVAAGGTFTLSWCSPDFSRAGIRSFDTHRFEVNVSSVSSGGPYSLLATLDDTTTSTVITADGSNVGKTCYYFVRVVGQYFDHMFPGVVWPKDSNKVTVTVNAAPTIVSFRASRSKIDQGQSSTLSWELSGASSATISPDVGSVGPTGTATVTPSTTTTYVLTLGEATASATVVVGTTTKATVGTLAGKVGVPGSTDGGGGAARFNQPTAVTAAPDVTQAGVLANDLLGTSASPACCIYVADGMNHTIRQLDAAGNALTIAGAAGSAGFLNGTGTASKFDFRPDSFGLIGGGVAVAGGNIYVADSNNHLIRKIDSLRKVTTFAGKQGQPGSADGVGTAASFRYPTHLAADGAGNLYVADTDNHLVRKITPAGAVTTLAGQAGVAGSTDGPALGGALLNRPRGIALDNGGNVWITELGTETLRKISASGQVTTEVGGGGVSPFDFSTTGGGLAVNPQSGDKYVTNTGNQTVDKVSPGMPVVPVAGTPGVSGSSDGTGAEAQFDNPSAVAFDWEGNLVIADTDNHTMRSAVPPCTRRGRSVRRSPVPSSGP